MGTQRDYSDDETALLKACRNGDLAAYELLVLRHQRMMINIAFRVTGVYEDACDIVQDSFITAWQKLGDFRGESKFSTWLTAIVLNLSRNRYQQLRQRERYEAYSLDAPAPGSSDNRLHEPSSGAVSAQEQLEESDLRGFLQRCINALSPEFREVLVLRDMQELPYEEVASTLGLKDGTVKSRLFRARDAVKECLKKTGAL